MWRRRQPSSFWSSAVVRTGLVVGCVELLVLVLSGLLHEPRTWTSSIGFGAPVVRLGRGVRHLGLASHGRQLLGRRLQTWASTSDFHTGSVLEDGVQWLDVVRPSSVGKDPQPGIASDPDIFPLLPVDDVFLPGAGVAITVSSASDCRLYEELLLAGGRFIIASLRGRGQDVVAAWGTVLFLEELKDVSSASEGQAKYIAEHRVVGRVKLRRVFGTASGATGRRAGYWTTKVEPVAEDVDSKAAIRFLQEEAPLQQQIAELERLQRECGSTGDSGRTRTADSSAVVLPHRGLAKVLVERPPLPSQLVAVQGLWQGNSGARIRIDGDEVVGLGRISAADGGRLRVELTGATQQDFWGERSADESDLDAPAQTLQWDDGDTWTRIAGPPPYKFDHFGADGAMWRAIRSWHDVGAQRAEVRRGAERFRSADAIAQRLAEEDGLDEAETVQRLRAEEAAAAEWQRKAERADAMAATSRWEEVLLPCQRLLQASSPSARAELFREDLAVEAMRLRLSLAASRSSGEGEERSSGSD